MKLSRCKLSGLLLMFVGVICLIHWLTCYGGTSAPGSDDNKEGTRLDQSLNEYYLELRRFIKAPWGEDGEPSGLYEATRHRLHGQIKELSYYVSSGLKAAIAEQDPKNRHEILHNTLADLERRENMLLVEQQRLSSVDGHAERRARHAADLSGLVQRRLRALQNPPDCAAAKKLICDLNLYCGFGCQIHHVVYCLRAAYATERTLILNSRAWAYQPSWDSLFEPLSDNCYNITYDKKEVVKWPGSKEAKLVDLQIRSHAPLGAPKDLVHRIMSFTGDPGSWFVGQILKYILRPRTSFQKAIDDTIANLNYRHPVVGMHIRRTDKLIWEAKFHSIDEYMQQAEKYWVRRDLARKPGDPLTPRRVYLATDEAVVWKKARSKYQSVEFLGDEHIARSAALDSRWSLASLTGVMVDLLLLSRSDYLVCTFSSNVGRAAYELMQTNNVHASESHYSVDNPYEFFGNYRYAMRNLTINPEEDLAFAQETENEEPQLYKSTKTDITNNPQEASSDAEDQWVLLPWFKTDKVPVFYNYPEYKQVTANTVRDETKNVTIKNNF